MNTTTMAPAAPAARPGPRVRDVRRHLRAAAPGAVLLLLVAVVTIAEPAFVSGQSLLVVANQAVPIVLLGLGQMFVVLTGGIDLSVAAVTSLGTVVLALALPGAGMLAVPLVLVALTLVGALTGLVSAYVRCRRSSSRSVRSVCGAPSRWPCPGTRPSTSTGTSERSPG